MENGHKKTSTQADSSRKNCSGKGRRLNFLLILGFAVIVVVWIFREPLQRAISRSATLANPSPPPELVEELIEKSPDRTAAILSAWQTGKIVHRQVAMRQISQITSLQPVLPAPLESMVLSGALDADMNVRETALGILQFLKHPALPALAAAQLADPDPQLRLLGLNHLKQTGTHVSVPIVIPLLDDDDPLIVASILKLLEKVSGENFGVKLSDTLSFENEKTGLKEFREGSHEKAKAGASRAKVWWAAHQNDFPSANLVVPKEIVAARQWIKAEEFSLHSLDGHSVRLSDFRGKVVLINFWTTWCTACLIEMPELIALQKRHGDELAILGVSLDFVPDSHGHIGGHAEEHHEASPDDKPNAKALNRVREKVRDSAKARGINYTVLLDEKNEVGGRFNGGELPTTVILDAQGNIRRRFIGARSFSVFEKMIAEASRTVHP